MEREGTDRGRKEWERKLREGGIQEGEIMGKVHREEGKKKGKCKKGGGIVEGGLGGVRLFQKRLASKQRVACWASSHHTSKSYI
jgi:hypothetical protein